MKALAKLNEKKLNEEATVVLVETLNTPVIASVSKTLAETTRTAANQELRAESGSSFELRGYVEALENKFKRILSNVAQGEPFLRELGTLVLESAHGGHMTQFKESELGVSGKALCEISERKVGLNTDLDRNAFSEHFNDFIETLVRSKESTIEEKLRIISQIDSALIKYAEGKPLLSNAESDGPFEQAA